MHDGQNIFDTSDSVYKMSWNVDKTVDRLVKEGKIQEIIIVGIDNNENRGSEYCHFMPEKMTYGRIGDRKCESDREVMGILYEDFIVHSLKPYIDEHFRTLKDRDNTAMMGSSMGGLVTYLIGFRHPEVFSKLGILSPAFHWLDFNQQRKVQKKPLKIWMDSGEGEAYYVENTRRVVKDLVEKGFIPKKELVYYQVPEAIHNEDSWAKRVYLPLLFFFGTMGKPVFCKLTGRNLFGIGMETTINPIVHYDSDLIMTDINGSYTVEDPHILEVRPSGDIVPKTCGATRVTYEIDEVMDTKIFAVMNELSDTVRIELEISVPSSTPQQEKVFVYAGGFIEAQRDRNGRYQCEITIPRDWGYHFSFFKGDTHIGELDKDGNPMKSRFFKAVEDCQIKYIVERWAE